MDTNRLLSPENVNREKLMQYAREAADFSTEHRLPQLPFALNHYGREDVAMFDFTCMYAAQNAGRVMERHGHRLLLQLVGDSLLEVRRTQGPALGALKRPQNSNRGELIRSS